jgi:hypothetical protein
MKVLLSSFGIIRDTKKEYLRINEIGVVPILVHNGIPIRNS